VPAGAPAGGRALPAGTTDRPPPTLTPDAVLGLQRLWGNQAVQRLVPRPSAAPRIVRRLPAGPGPGPAVAIQRTAGLATERTIGTFAKAARAVWKGDEFRHLPLKELGDVLLDEVNYLLPVPCEGNYEASGPSRGQFNRTHWTISFNPKAFTQRPGVTTIGQLSEDEVAALVDTIYHEARHADQWFRVARVWAGRGKTASEIAKALVIPQDVATQAAAAPLRGATEKDQKLVKESEGWEAFMVGRYNERYRVFINDAVKTTLKNQQEFKAAAEAAADDRSEGEERAETNQIMVEPLLEAINTSNSKIAGPLLALQTEVLEASDLSDSDEIVLKYTESICNTFYLLEKAAREAKRNPGSIDFAKLSKLHHAFYEALYTAYENTAHEQDAYAVGGAAAKAFKKLPST
jgi:hypothetical protein